MNSVRATRRVGPQPRTVVRLQQGAQRDHRCVQIELLINAITVGRPMLLVVAPGAVRVLTPEEERDAGPMRGKRVELEVGHGADQLGDQIGFP